MFFTTTVQQNNNAFTTERQGISNPRITLNGAVFTSWNINSQDQITFTVPVSRGDVVEVFETLGNTQPLSFNVKTLNIQETRRRIIALYKNLQYELERGLSEGELENYLRLFLQNYSTEVFTTTALLNKENFLENFSPNIIYGTLPFLRTVSRYSDYLGITEESVKNLICISLVSGNYGVDLDQDVKYDYILRPKTDENLGFCPNEDNNRPNSLAYSKIDLGTKELLYSLISEGSLGAYKSSDKVRGYYFLGTQAENLKYQEVFKNLHHFVSGSNEIVGSVDGVTGALTLRESVDSLKLRKLQKPETDDSSFIEGFEIVTSLDVPQAQVRKFSKNFVGNNIERALFSSPLPNLRDVVSSIAELKTEVDFVEEDEVPKVLEFPTLTPGFAGVYLKMDKIPSYSTGFFVRFNDLFYNSDFISIVLGAESSFISHKVAIKNATVEGTTLTISYDTPGVFEESEEASVEIDLTTASSAGNSGVVYIEKDGVIRGFSLNSNKNLTTLIEGAGFESFHFIETLDDAKKLALGFEEGSKEEMIFITKNRIKAGVYSLLFDVDPKGLNSVVRRDKFFPLQAYAVDLSEFRTSDGVFNILTNYMIMDDVITLTFINEETAGMFMGVKFFADGLTANYDKVSDDITVAGNIVQIRGDFSAVADQIDKLLIYISRELDVN